MRGTQRRSVVCPSQAARCAGFHTLDAGTLYNPPALLVVRRAACAVAEMITESIGQRVRRLRTERGLLQKQLAEKARITTHCVGHIERDKFATNMFAFIEIGKALGVSLDYLAYGEDYRHGNQSDNQHR